MPWIAIHGTAASAFVGAPFTVLADVFTCALGAVMNARVRVEEPPLPRRPSTPADLGYRQSVTPDELQGRMNATIRSANRTCAVIGALAGGLIAQLLGLRPALWVAVALFVVAAVVVLGSPLRTARHDFHPG